LFFLETYGNLNSEVSYVENIVFSLGSDKSSILLLLGSEKSAVLPLFSDKRFNLLLGSYSIVSKDYFLKAAFIVWAVEYI